MPKAIMNGTPVALDSRVQGQLWSRRARPPLLIAALFLLLHIVLVLTVDVSDPEAFLRADRADVRLSALQGLLASSSPEQLTQYLSAHGIIGDYAAHAVLYALGGRYAVILVQIALAVVSGLAVYRLASLLGLKPRLCAIAMSVYMFLPHTLVFPHQLASEALHVPLFVISNWLLAEAIRKPVVHLLGWSAICLGVATLIRPITLLWPVVASVAVAIKRRPLDGVLYGCLAVLPVLAWMCFVAIQTGSFGLGESGHSMGSNLYQRVIRITATMPAAQRATAREAHLPESERILGPLAYLRFTADYPVASLAHVGRDAVAFFVKSGVERVTIDYLALNANAEALQDQNTGWRRQLELNGPVATLSYLWQTIGAVLLVSLAGAGFLLILVIAASIGAIHVIRQWRELREPPVLIGFMLIAVVLYTFTFSQVLNAMQSRQRAPAEFALVLLATLGLNAWRVRRQRQPFHNESAAK